MTDNHKKKMEFSVYLAFYSVIVVLMVPSGFTAVNAKAYAAMTNLPTCTDPTGQNLPCMMVISTLPPPPNVIQCQETSGQILPCSYATQSLSNGEQVVVITVYVPANYVFTGYGPWTVVKQVVRETKTITKTKIECPGTQRLNPETHRCIDVPICQKDQHLIFVGGRFICFPIHPICHPTLLVPCPRPPPPPPSCDSKYYTGPCPPTDPNAYTKCISAALAAKDDKNGLACARLLPDTPENAYTKCISEALFNDDNIAALKCAKLLPPVNAASNNMTNTTSVGTPPTNTSASIQPTNTSIPTTPTGGKGSGPTCSAGNCTSGTKPPPVDCTKNPSDPSCTQTLTPLTLPPTTKTCPDGSVIDASANCPASSSPSPPSNNPPPPSSPSEGSGGNNGGGNNGGSGSSSGSDGGSGSSNSGSP